MRSGLVLLVALAAWLAGSPVGVMLGIGVARAQEPEARLLGQVLAAVDGGTLRVRLEGGSVETVRMRGVIAPASASSANPVGCFGPEAAARLSILAPAGSTIELDVEAPERDSAGRLMAYVWRPNAMLMVNQQLLAEGYAVVSPTVPDAYAEPFNHAQEIARTHSLGLWSACPDSLPEPADDR